MQILKQRPGPPGFVDCDIKMSHKEFLKFDQKFRRQKEKKTFDEFLQEEVLKSIG